MEMLSELSARKPLAYLGEGRVKALKRDEQQRRDTVERSLEQLMANGFAPKTVIDVGAAFGDWSTRISGMVPDALIYGVEPVEGYRPELESLERRLGCFKWLKSAVSDRCEEATFNEHPNVTSSSLLKEEAGPEEDGEPKSLRTTTLDRLFAKESVESPLLLKTDTQGMDLRVLRGAEGLLAFADVVVTEAFLIPFLKGSCSLAEIVNFLSERGFALHDITNLVYRPLDEALAQVDLVFVREGSFGRDQLVFADEGNRRQRVEEFVERLERRRGV